MNVTLGDYLCGQEQDFQVWAAECFKISCEEYGLSYDHVPINLLTMENMTFTEDNTRLEPTDLLYEDSIDSALGRFHSKNVLKCRVKKDPSELFNSNVDESCVLVEISIGEQVSRN